MRRLLVAIPLIALALSAQAQAPAGAPVPGPVLGASAARAAAPAPRPGSPRVVKWDELVPADWDPMKDFKGTDFGLLQDGDPRAAAALKQLRAAWNNAPANDQLAGQAIRIPGYVVPLEEGPDGLKEFLLVPYFGACIHTPPPPANQIIHVLSSKPVKGVRSMDAVWVAGPLAIVRTDSFMGAASYRIEAQAVEPYGPRAP